MFEIQYIVATGENLDKLCAWLNLKRKEGESDIELRKRLMACQTSNFKYSLINIYS